MFGEDYGILLVCMRVRIRGDLMKHLQLLLNLYNSHESKICEN